MRTKPLPVGVQVGQSCPELQNALGKLRLARGECLFRAPTAAKAKGDHISVEKSDVFNQQTCHSLPISMCNGWITPHARKVLGELHNGSPLLFTDPLVITFPQLITFLLGILPKFSLLFSICFR